MAQRPPIDASGRQVLTDRAAIRQWAEARGGVPARVCGTVLEDVVGRLRIAFPDDWEEEPLEPISWAEWFETLTEKRLALIVVP